MICPICKKEMEKGFIDTIMNNYILSWHSSATKKGPLGIKIPAKKIQLGTQENGYINNAEAHYCPNCSIIITPVIAPEKIKPVISTITEDEFILQARQTMQDSKENESEEENTTEDNFKF